MLDYTLIKELQDLEIVSKITILKESTEIFFNNCNHNRSKLKFEVIVTLNNNHIYTFTTNKGLEKFLVKIYEGGETL